MTIPGDSANDRAGDSVAISGDGMTLAVGAPGFRWSTERPGYVKVYYKQPDSSWLLAENFTGEADDDEFGGSVSLSADGKTLAIGADRNDGNGTDSGHVRVYTVVGSEWQKLGQDIDGEAAGDRSGVSVSLSADGTTVAIGAPYNDGNNGTDSGHVRVYTVVGIEWQKIGQDIDGEAASDYSANSVSLSADGTTVAIGANLNDGNGDTSGHVRVYNLVSSEWQQIGQDINGEAAYDRSGFSVSLSADGTTVAIGAIWNNGNGSDFGHVRVYHLDDSGSSSSWVQVGINDIDGVAAGDRTGWSVSLSSDGKSVAVGSPYNDDNGADAGNARVFSVPNSSPITSQLSYPPSQNVSYWYKIFICFISYSLTQWFPFYVSLISH